MRSMVEGLVEARAAPSTAVRVVPLHPWVVRSRGGSEMNPFRTESIYKRGAGALNAGLPQRGGEP